MGYFRSKLLVTVLTMISAHARAAGASDSIEEDSAAEVSPVCAAALLTTGGTLGAAAGAALAAALAASLPAITCATSGFCAAGVAKGSYAASWQVCVNYAS